MGELSVPMPTVEIADVIQNSKHGDEFNTHLGFIKQKIVDFLKITSNIRSDKKDKLIKPIRREMNNKTVGLVVIEKARSSNTYNVAPCSSRLQLNVKSLVFFFYIQK